MIIKKSIIYFLILLLIISYSQLFAQEKILYSYSNVSALAIESISVNEDNTTVIMKFYTENENFVWVICSKLYIQEYGEEYSTKYYITDFKNNLFDYKYRDEVFKTSYYTLIFEKIPYGLTHINIMEDNWYCGKPSWYWKNITINNPYLK